MDLTVLADLPPRLDDRQLAAVEHIAGLPAPVLPPVSETHLLRCMRTLTLLPARQEDDLSGELRLALYRKHFGHQPEAAWSFLVEHATLECRFFPTPKECVEILARWSRQDGPHRAHQLAIRAAAAERQARFDDLMLRFREGQVTQEEVDGLPERWKRIAAVQGYLREDGTYALRPVRGVPEQGSEAPADLSEQYTGQDGKAGQPHERTGQ